MVLDACAFVTLFCGDVGADRVAAALEQPTLLSALSALELARRLPHVPARDLLASLRRLGVELVPLEAGLALEIGALATDDRESAVVAALAKSRGVRTFLLSENGWNHDG